MKAIVLTILKICVAQTIPNPHTIQNLTVEQQQVIMQYVKYKCEQEVNTMACQKYYEQYKKVAKECQPQA